MFWFCSNPISNVTRHGCVQRSTPPLIHTRTHHAPPLESGVWQRVSPFSSLVRRPRRALLLAPSAPRRHQERALNALSPLCVTACAGRGPRRATVLPSGESRHARGMAPPRAIYHNLQPLIMFMCALPTHAACDAGRATTRALPGLKPSLADGVGACLPGTGRTRKLGRSESSREAPAARRGAVARSRAPAKCAASTRPPRHARLAGSHRRA